MPRSQPDSTEKITLAGADFIFDTRKPEDLLAKLGHTPATSAIESTTGRTRAYIKIQDGCDRYCSYCIVPYVRGPVTSRPPADILAEAQTLISHGAQEIVLTGIQVAAYGYDTTSLPKLIQMLAGFTKRIRLSSIDPWAVNDEFLAVVRDTPELCAHFHLSLQSGSDNVLTRMNRRYTTADYAQAATQLKQLRPDMALTTDIIVGFPGETESDFQDSLHFAEEMGFSQIHVFEYSQRSGTKAADFPGQVPSHIKSKRGQEMRELAAKLKTQFLQSQIGQIANVLFEDTTKGHTENYCQVQCTGTPNEIAKVHIIDATHEILIGNIV